MKTYLIRAVKYLLSMCVLCIALMALMLVTGNSALTLDETLYAMFHTDRYLLLFGAIVILSAVYPRFGFIARNVEGDVVKNREQIINAFRSSGFELVSEQSGQMVFRAGSFFKKLMLLFEDEITVTQEGLSIRVDGIRRGVARVVYRLDSYIQMAKRNE